MIVHSLPCAMTSDGILEHETTAGSINADKFMDFITRMSNTQHVTISSETPNSYLDNCSIHHACDVKDLLNSFGILHVVSFLPPYSPDYKPIEELFSYVKYYTYLKAHDDIIDAIGDPLLIIHSAFQSVLK